MPGYARHISPNRVEVRWSQIRVDKEGTGFVAIERSEAPHAGFDLIAQDVDSKAGIYYDQLPQPYHNRTVYYRVNGHLLHVDERPGAIAREIVRRNKWFLRSQYHHSGSENVAALIQRIDAPRCTECWDPVQEKVTRSKCLTCHGTGITDPYFYPLATYVSNSPRAHVHIPGEDRISLGSQTQVWTSNYPLFKPGDMLKRPDGYLWRVENVQLTRQGRFIVSQAMSLKQLETAKDEYLIRFSAPPEAVEEVDGLFFIQGIQVFPVDGRYSLYDPNA